VNGPIIRVFGVVLVLFGVLVFFTTRWTVIERDELRDNPRNKRALLEQERIARGAIIAADDSTIARSARRPDGTYTRRYPQGSRFAQTVGYAYLNPGTAGLERRYNGELLGREQGLETALRRLQGKRQRGNDLRTALDPLAQQIAIDGLGGRTGAVVALDPRTGRVKVAVSIPDYDPNVLRRSDAQARLNRAEGAPLLNRVTSGLYPPGSTMKVVTAIAAIDSGRFTPGSTLEGRSGIEISGVPLANFGGTDFGRIDLTTALTNSVNTVWAQVAEQLGKQTMGRYMERLGFYRKAEVDLPPDERLASGTYCRQDGKLRLVPATADCVDIGRAGIGQDVLLSTPLQMAMVAAAVANNGVLMRPFIATRAIDADGRTTLDNQPEEMARVMKPSTASAVTEMMKKVVQEGSGTAAALQGIDVAGKTGTAERDVSRNITQPWFIAFAPADAPRVAIAATVERSVGGLGGTEAAPIAKAVMESLLR
jgi:peptidoglycan glycosyltransferase